MKERENFTGKFGFVISCVGAALGLGNIWLFSYRLGQYGGAAFLIPYFLFVFILGTTGLITEFSFGRKFKAGSYTGIVESFKSKSLKEESLWYAPSYRINRSFYILLYSNRLDS